MSIRFACTHCRQKLAISARKAGTHVQCPKCQTQLTVPQPSAESLPVAPSQSVAVATTSAVKPKSPNQPRPSAPVPAKLPLPPPPVKPPGENRPSFSSLNLDVMMTAPSATTATADVPVLALGDTPLIDINPPSSQPAIAPLASRLVGEVPRGVAASSPTSVVVDPSLVAIPRGMLYAQAGVLVALALVAFTLGYWTGRAVSPTDEQALAALAQPVQVEGDAMYRAADGTDVPDAGAVVIVVPHQLAPRDRLPIEGLRPQDPLEDDQMNPAILALENEGGAYARVAATGQFWLKARPGRYWLLLVSANATRADGALPRVRDVSLLGKYFEQAADLIENRRYQLVEVQLPQDAPLELALD